MAVFVVTSQTKNRAYAKASIRYFVHRRDRDQEKLTRTVYARHGISNKYEAYKAIDKAAAGTTFFRLVLNFDPVSEDANRDLDLRRITEQTMRDLQKRFKNQRVLYFASIHDNQKGTDLRHIHILALINGRLRPLDLKALRKAVTKHALSQRQELDGQTQEGVPLAAKLRRRELWLWRRRFLRGLFPGPDRLSQQGRDDSRSSSGSRPQNPSCLSCGPGIEMNRLTRTLFHCVSCGSITKDTGFGIEIVRSPQLELSLGKEAGGI